MKNILKTMLLLATVATSTGAFVSCSDDDDLPKADSLFRPIINTDDNIVMGLDENLAPYMIVTWDNYTSANQYTVKVEATDNSDSKEITTSELTCRFDNLQYDKEYFVYISSANTQTGLSSKAYSLTATTPDYPTSLITPAATDIIDIAARIKWSNDANYDKLVVVSDADGEQVAEIALTAEEQAAHEKIVTGLQPKTTYRIEAYNGANYLGKKRITTAAADNFSGNIVDLRGWAENDAYKFIENNLDSLMTQVYPNQDITVILEGGTTYRLKATKLNSTSGTIKFVTGQTLAGYAILEVNSNFDLNAEAQVGGLIFEKINIWGAQPEESDGNFGGQYVFNIAGKDSKIDLIRFVNCDIKWKRGILRQKDNASTVVNFEMDNCTCDSIAGYGIANSDKEGAVVQNIKVSNSTFSTCKVMFTNTKGKIAPNSVTIENCTFVNCPQGGKFITDFKGNKPTGDFYLKNCLFGPGQAELAIWSGSDKPEGSDIFYTSDIVWKPTSEEDPTPVAQLAGTTIATDVAGTFKNWAEGDFTILNTRELKNVGDPRWY